MPVGNLPFVRYTRFFEALSTLYDDMDRAYHAAADYYGFKCAGCEDNCCQTKFHHHTYIEQLYLLNGFFSLDYELQETIRKRSKSVNQQVLESESRGLAPWVMCALNDNGRCLLYAHRPMICRLHGIPHEFKPPGKEIVYGPGCEEFVRQCRDRGYTVFDRTPFYLSMADLEKRFKGQFGFSGKVKKTVSEILVLE